MWMVFMNFGRPDFKPKEKNKNIYSSRYKRCSYEKPLKKIPLYTESSEDVQLLTIVDHSPLLLHQLITNNKLNFIYTATF